MFWKVTESRQMKKKEEQFTLEGSRIGDTNEKEERINEL